LCDRVNGQVPARRSLSLSETSLVCTSWLPLILPDLEKAKKPKTPDIRNL